MTVPEAIIEKAFQAVENTNTDSLQKLLNSYPDLLKVTSSRNGEALLLKAWNKLPLVPWLLAKNADPNLPNYPIESYSCCESYIFGGYSKQHNQ